MKRFIMFLLFAAITTVVPARLGAQGAEGKLLPLKTAALDHVGNKVPCGPYFNFTGAPADPTKVGLVLFVYEVEVTRGKTTAIMSMGSDKLEIHVVPIKKTPTAKMIRPGGPVYPWFVIEISESDFRRAPCLTHSEVKREPNRARPRT